ncbi:protein FAR1-RELATED SEQUENCE 5 isoform X2 [Rosa chinensis]|nr:protein FAR1-RELATED SEQUENCE 5 isoform X2 [Rosa chinensis]
MEQEPLDAGLQISMSSDDMEDDLQSNHPSSIIEVPIVNGKYYVLSLLLCLELIILFFFDLLEGPSMIDDSDEFLSLSTKFFENREDLVSAIRKIGLLQGYVMVITRSRSNRDVAIGCDRGGCYRTCSALEEKKKNSASRRIDCPFKIVGRRTAEGLWKVEISSLLHNHEPSTDMAGHPYCRRFTKEEASQVEQMSRAGIKPRQILSSLRQSNPDLLAVSRNIYSKTSQFRRESLGGRSIIQALLDELGGAGFSHNVKYDHSGHLTHLFFAHPTSIELTKSYSNVFVMDCTYKTNKYKMPLLEIVGVSSFNTSFYSCFVFMQKEEQQDYQWALEMFSKLLGDGNHPLAIIIDRELALMKAIQVVFPMTPNLLCIWHIEKNILAHCKGQFKEDADWVGFMSSWSTLVKSWDVSTFNEVWNRFQIEYKDYASILTYIGNTWLPWKERFVFAWTGQISHFGNNVTSRAEGAHGTLKKYLQVSTGGLREVKENICLAIQNQFQEIRTQLASEKIRVPQKLCIPFFKEVINKVSFYALFELQKQYLLANAKDYSSQCKGQFSKTMGLPCVHMIKEINIEVLPLNQIHEQWRIGTRSFTNDHRASLDHEDPFSSLLSEVKEKYEKQPLAQKENTIRQLSQILGASCPLIFKPTLQPHKGRPVGSNKRKETSSTRREPSYFERVEKAPRKCSGCGNIGHYRNKCPSNNKSTTLGTQ